MAVVKLTRAMADKAVAETDWAAQDALTDNDIARQVASNSDAAPILGAAETVAALARTIRYDLGLSQEEFARQYGIALETLRDWEQAREPVDHTAMRFLLAIPTQPLMAERALRNAE